MTEYRKKQHPGRKMRFYGQGIPYLHDTVIKGKLIVIEGPDASGRSTQIDLITSKLEADGHAVLNTGLKRSELISEGILLAQQSHTMGRRTLSLFYTADFADQLENKIVPALEAGYVVLADRYIYTLMARAVVRGLGRKWTHDLFGFALIPDLVFYLDVDPFELVHRVFLKRSSLDYYESGVDIGLSDDMYESFIVYQRLLAKEFHKMPKEYGLVIIDGNRTVQEINADLQKRIDTFLGSSLNETPMVS